VRADHPLAHAPDVHEDPGHHQRQDDVGPAIGDERQRQPRGRQEADDDADVLALKGWRREIFGEKAIALKHGRLGLAVQKGKVVAFARS
jgi:hypothetical protein